MLNTAADKGLIGFADLKHPYTDMKIDVRCYAKVAI